MFSDGHYLSFRLQWQCLAGFCPPSNEETDSGVLSRLTVAMPGVRTRAQPQGSYVPLWGLTEEIVPAMPRGCWMPCVSVTSHLYAWIQGLKKDGCWERDMKWKKISQNLSICSQTSLWNHTIPRHLKYLCHPSRFNWNVSVASSSPLRPLSFMPAYPWQKGGTGWT